MKKSIALSALLVLSLPFGQASAAGVEDTYRISGMNRFETSANISFEGWETSEVAVIATGRDFPDALSATPLAYKYDAPLLLTDTKNLPGSVAEELVRLEVKEVILIGGASVISADVVKQLNDLGITNISRISGKDRFETSVNIAKEVGPSNGIVVAAGKSFADALSIAPVAAQLGAPILLTQKEDLPAAVDNYVKSLDLVEGSIVVGGEGVISNHVLTKLPAPERLSGADRYATNSKIISHFADEGILDMDFPFIATGANYPDALSASALAAGSYNGVILTDPVNPKTTTKDTVKNYSGLAEEYIIVGGEKALPDSTIAKLFN